MFKISLRQVGITAFMAAAGLANAQQTVTVGAQMQHCATPPKLYTFDGLQFKEVQQAAGEAARYRFDFQGREHRFYYVGTDANTHTPMILGAEDNVQLVGDCNNGRAIAVSGSPINEQYNSLKAEFGRLNGMAQQASMAYRAAMSNPAAMPQAVQSLGNVDVLRQQLLDSLQRTNPFLARVAALNTYLSFPNHGQGRYSGELEYFAAEFFRFVNWQDDGYNHLPWVFESYKSYTATLSDVPNLPEQLLTKFLEKSLEAIPMGSGARRMALAGMMTTLESKNSPSFVSVAERFIKEYGANYPDAANALRSDIQRIGGMREGAVAPDFTQKTPEGTDLSLSDLRGKVVLIDFWASWCGPCRRENPYVVQLYNQYKDKGFEILGVSLDRNRESWLQAIKDDNLTWKHVSDLQFWQNAAAKLYGVSSIPHTVLIDREGKIIARGLRSAELSQLLPEVLD